MTSDHLSALRDYLAGAGLSEAAFARRIGVGAEELRAVLSGSEACSPAMARLIEDACDGAVDADDLIDGNVAALRFRADVDEVSESALLQAFQASGLVEAGVISATLLAPAVRATINTFDGIGAISGLQRRDRLLLALRAVLKEIAADCGVQSRDVPAHDEASIEAVAHDIRRRYQPAD